MFQSRNIENEVWWDPQCPPDLLFGHRAVPGEKSPQVGPVGDDADFAGFDPGIVLEVTPGRFADGDDPGQAPHQAGQEAHDVEGAQGIVLLGHMQLGEVMDGANTRNAIPPGQAAVARRHEDDVAVVTAQGGGQADEVPEDADDRVGGPGGEGDHFQAGVPGLGQLGVGAVDEDQEAILRGQVGQAAQDVGHVLADAGLALIGGERRYAYSHTPLQV
jgi:hypothetical protein